jgi:hypothetical protein
MIMQMKVGDLQNRFAGLDPEKMFSIDVECVDTDLELPVVVVKVPDEYSLKLGVSTSKVQLLSTLGMVME